jgi:hypothetical protein
LIDWRVAHPSAPLAKGAGFDVPRLNLFSNFYFGSAPRIPRTEFAILRGASANCGTIWGQNFTYDAFGNIAKSVMTGDGGVAFQATYSTATNRIASFPSFVPTYDANGNLTSDPLHSYTWNCDGRPVTIDSISLTYDAIGRLVEGNNGGTFTQNVYSPDLLP